MSPISYQQYRSVLFSSYSHHDLLSLVLVCLFVCFCNRHSNKYKVIFHCGSDLYFSGY